MRPVRVSTSDASGGAKSSPVIPLDLYLNPFNVSLRAVVTGVANYDVQYTEDDVFASNFNPATATWLSLSDMTAATANAYTTLISPVTAVRLVQNSGDGSVQLTVLQSGAVS